MSEYTKVRVGDYLVIGTEKEWKVMEQFGSYRMLKKTCKTLKAGELLAAEMDAKRKAS